jgi:uncharacterized membrane protein YheB (UPF0754 family)
MFLDRNLFTGKTLFKVKKINVGEDMEAYVRQISLADYTKITEASEKLTKSGKEDAFEMPIQMIIASICDEYGNKVFNEADRDRLVETIPMSMILKLSREIAAFNNLNAETNAEAGVVDKIKNSTTTPNESSYSVLVES